MSEIRFIHAADLHIESPYKGLSQSNAALGKALVNYSEQAYHDLIAKCIQESIDFLLISGDSFDSEAASLKAQFDFVSGLKKLEKEGIQVYIICGNHDPLNQWPDAFKIPSNVHLFDTATVSRKSFKKNGKEYAIYGSSFIEKEEYRNLAKTYRRASDDYFAIGLLHGMLEGAEGHDKYNPFTMDDLRAAGMDYWALGHIHKREVLNEAHPLAIYSGNLQGRHFNESGAKGCYLIEVKGNQISNYTFLPISKVCFSRESLDLSALTEIDDLMEKLEERRSELLEKGQSQLLRLRLYGQTELFSTLQQSYEVKSLFDQLNEQNNYKQQFVFLDKVINDTNPLVDFEDRAKANDFIGSLLSNFKEYAEDEEKLKTLTRHIFEEIKGKKAANAIRETGLDFEDPEFLKQLIESAKDDCVGGLIVAEKQKK